jgi:hypothetical protein
MDENRTGSGMRDKGMKAEGECQKSKPHKNFYSVTDVSWQPESSLKIN